MLYNGKEKLWNKENKLFSWQTSRKVNSFLVKVETISSSWFPSRKWKNRGIPLWQHQQEITSFLLPDWNMKRFSSTWDTRFSPLWKHWGLCCHVSSSLQLPSNTNEFVPLLLRSLLLQLPHAACVPKNRETRLALSQHLTVTFSSKKLAANPLFPSEKYFNSDPFRSSWIKPLDTSQNTYARSE